MKDSDVELRHGQPPVDSRLSKSNSPALCPFTPGLFGAVWGCLGCLGLFTSTASPHLYLVKESVLCAGAFLSDTSLQVSERSREDACVTSGTQ